MILKLFDRILFSSLKLVNVCAVEFIVVLMSVLMADLGQDVDLDHEVCELIFGLEDADLCGRVDVRFLAVLDLVDFSECAVAQLAHDLPDLLSTRFFWSNSLLDHFFAETYLIFIYTYF